MHNDLFSIGPFHVYGYGLMIAIGIFCAYVLAEYRARRIDGLDDEVVFGLTWWAVVCGLIGGKVLYFVTILPTIIKNPSMLFQDLIEGFVIYGALIGGVVGVVLYCRLKKLNCMSYFDLAVPSVALAQGFGRIGCLLAGCCYGRETDSPFGIVFQTSEYAPNGIPLVPTQIISSALNFLHFIILIVFAKKYKKGEGQGAGLFFILYSAGRFVLEFFRGDMERGNVGVLSTSQFIAIFMVIFGLILFFALGKRGGDKVAASVSIIGGADGPTSIFLAGKVKDEKARELEKQKLEKLARTIEVNPHTLEETERYLVEKYQAVLLPSDSEEVQREEQATRGTLVLRHKPELVQTPEPEYPKSREQDELKRFGEQILKRTEEAEHVSAKEFPLDFKKYQIRLEEKTDPGEDAPRDSRDACLDICIEKNYEFLQLSYSYSGKEYERKLKEIMKDIYLYYGVTQEDVENYTERFLVLAGIIKQL